MNELNNLYFDWIYQLVCKGRRKPYRKLLMFLHSVEFIYSLPMDENRAEDGVDLRYRFGYEQKIERRDIKKYLCNRPCSVLEMMVALAMKCEEHIMANPEFGDRLDKWFWIMISNLGLLSMNDSRFDKDHALKIIDIFLNREYSRNGEGGLFIIQNPRRDLRNVEIWYQMCWYLNEFLKNNEL